MLFAVQGRCATGVRHFWGCNDETNTPAAPSCARCRPRGDLTTVPRIVMLISNTGVDFTHGGTGHSTVL